MAKVCEFVMGSHGDPSVGIFAFEERVTVIFHGSSMDSESEDTLKSIGELLAEIADGYCELRDEHDKVALEVAVREALDYEEWKKDHPGEVKEKG